MSSTILSIIQQFCYRTNIPAPAAIVGVNSPAEQQYLSLLKFIGDNLRNRPFQWPQLKRNYLFLTTTGVSNYQLPGDFYRILDSTQFDVTNHWSMNGPISDSNMAARTYGVVDIVNRKSYRIIGPTQYLYSTSPYTQRSQGWFQISPAGVNNTDQLYLGYQSASWLWPKSWIASTSYAAGSIVSGNGYTYFTSAGGISGTTRPSHSSGTASDGTVSWTVWTEYYACDPANTSLSDSDLVLFDEDLMIDGINWALKRAKGQEFQQFRQDWEEQAKSAFARFEGPCSISMADDIGGDWPFVTPGSWPV
jgi:hypothetical protein